MALKTQHIDLQKSSPKSWATVPRGKQSVSVCFSKGLLKGHAGESCKWIFPMYKPYIKLREHGQWFVSQVTLATCTVLESVGAATRSVVLLFVAAVKFPTKSFCSHVVPLFLCGSVVRQSFWWRAGGSRAAHLRQTEGRGEATRSHGESQEGLSSDRFL